MISSLVFHLGDCKTGSTSIQAALAGKHWKAKGLKIEYPTVWNHIPLAKTLTTPTAPAMRREKFDHVARRFRKTGASHGVISAEHFEFADPRALKEAIDEAMPELGEKLRLIAYLRPHADRLVSSYAETVKLSGNLADLDAMLARFRRTKRLEYAPRLEKWRNVFGERFTVRPMIRTNLVRQDVVEDFFDYLFEGAPFQITEKAASNTSLSAEDLAMLRAIHDRIAAANKDLNQPRNAMGRNFGRMLHAIAPTGGTTKLRMHKALAKKVMRIYKDDAARVDAAFFDGTPMSDALAGAEDKAVDTPVSTRAEDYFDAAEIRRFHATADFLRRLIEADPQAFTRAARPPEQRRVSGPQALIGA